MTPDTVYFGGSVKRRIIFPQRQIPLFVFTWVYVPDVEPVALAGVIQSGDNVRFSGFWPGSLDARAQGEHVAVVECDAIEHRDSGDI